MRTRRQRFLFAGLLALIYLYPFPFFESRGMRSANERPRTYLTMAMVDEGTVAIDTGVRRWGTTADMSPSGGHLYSNKAPGSSILAIPAYLALKGVRALTGTKPSLAELTWTFRVWTGVLPTLLFLMLLWRFLRDFAPGLEERRAALVTYALGTMALIYSVLFIAHQLAAISIATGWILVVWVTERDLSRWLLGAAGFAAGFAVLCDYQAAFAGIPVAVYLLWQIRHDLRRYAVPLALATAAAAVPIAVLLLYHDAAFGSPFRTGYDASETFAHYHQRGFLGLDRPRLEAFVGSTVRPDNGLVYLSPALLLAIPGWVLLWRRRLFGHFAVTLSVACIYLAFISSLVFWRGGWQVGPRYVTAMLPFLMLPIAVALTAAQARTWTRGVALGLVSVSVVIYCASAITFPHFPEKFKNPLYELVFRLIGEGYAPPNGGWLLGLRGTTSLLPYAAAVLGVLGWTLLPARQRWRSAAIAGAVAVVVLALYSLPSGGGPVAAGAYRTITGWMP